MCGSQLRRNRLTVLYRAKWKCHYCNKKATTVDHKIPVSEDGGDRISNLIASCRHCNQERDTMSFVLFDRFVRLFGKPQTGWRTRTNWYKHRAFYNIMSNTGFEKACRIANRKWPCVADQLILKFSRDMELL